MTDGTAINDGLSPDATASTLDAVTDARAAQLALRIMARLRGHNLLPAEGGEAQDEFEATQLTQMIALELAR
jgi:hypothetical protein